jgi:hypothetical protein
MASTEIQTLLTYIEGFGLLLAFSSVRGHLWVDRLEQWARDYDIRKYKLSDINGAISEMILGGISSLPYIIFGGISFWAIFQGGILVGAIITFGVIVTIFRWFSDGNFTATLGVLIAAFGFTVGFIIP